VRAEGDKIDDRRPVGYFYGPYVGGGGEVRVVRPRPDLKSPDNCIAASMHRFGRKMPKSDARLRKRYLDFAKCFIRYFFPVLPSNTDVSFENWSADSKYTKGEISAFAQLVSDSCGLVHEDLLNKSFIKCESYNTYKFPRAINSYTDKAKAYCAPIQSVLDHAIYGLPWSVKMKDTSCRPAMMKELFGDSPVCGTDFSSMEAHFEEEFAEVRCFWKQWVGQKLPCIKDYIRVVRAKSLGVNLSRFKDVDVELMGKLMSGDCSTSSDNFVLDMTIIFFLCSETKYPHLPVLERVKRIVVDVKALFEGDDGIFTRVDIDQDIIDRLGIYLKLDKYEHFSEASFCGIVADRVNLVNTTDPFKILADFALLDPKYGQYRADKKIDLLRAKAMSYGFQFQNCPVISAFADYVLRVTRGRDVRWTLREADAYHRPILERAMKWDRLRGPVKIETRQVMERAFGLSVGDQIACENYFDALMRLEPIQPPCNFPELWQTHAEMFVVGPGKALDFPKYFDVPAVRAARKGALGGSIRKPRWFATLVHDAPARLDRG